MFEQQLWCEGQVYSLRKIEKKYETAKQVEADKIRQARFEKKKQTTCGEQDKGHCRHDLLPKVQRFLPSPLTGVPSLGEGKVREVL